MSWKIRRIGCGRLLVAVAVTVLGATGSAVVVASPAGAAVEPAAGQYVALVPARVVNDVSIASGDSYALNLLGKGGIPSSGVGAVTVTMTTRSAGSGHLIVYPAGTPRPTTSNLNYRPNIPTTNTVSMRVGSGGVLTVENAGATDVARIWVDVAGYFTATAPANAQSTYVPLTPARIVLNAANGAGASLPVNPLNRAGVPATNVSAVQVNITIRATEAGTASAYPDGITRPVSTAVNYQAGHVYNNQVPVRLGANGQFRVFTTTATEVTVDLVGYFQTPQGTANGGNFVGVDPVRLPVVVMDPRSTYTFSPLGRGGIPANGVLAAVFNLTATQTDQAGSLIVYPEGPTRPATNQLAYRAGGAWPTLQVARIGDGGQVSIRNTGDGSVRLLIDLVGYYRPATRLPGAPTAVAATPGDGQVIVRWTAPTDTGGAAITGYRITASPGGATVDVVNVTTAVFANLNNATAYTFTVAAVTAVGRGPASAPSAPTTPLAATAPGAPTGVVAEAQHTAVAVRWASPASDGRLPISRYTVTVSPGGTQLQVTVPSTEVLVPNLVNGTAYTFTVSATNARGTGPASATASATPTTTVPTTPTNVAVTAVTTGTIAVEWAPPLSDGGVPITGYQVRVQPGGRVIDAAADTTAIDITGLTAGTEYTFTVVATNARGASAASAATAPTVADFGLQPQARELSAAALATLTNVTPTAVVFTNAPAEVRNLVAGNVIIGAQPPASLPGFLRKVTGVSTTGTTTTVTTTDATVPEAFAKGGFDVAGGSGDFPTDQALRIADIGLGEIVIPLGDNQVAEGVTISGTLKLSPSVGYAYRFPFGDKYTIKLRSKLDLVFLAEHSVDFGPLERRLSSKELRIPGKKLVRWLPDVRQEVDLIASGSLTGRVSVSASIVSETTVTISAGQIIEVRGELQGRPDVHAPDASVAGELKFGIRVTYGFDLVWQKLAELSLTKDVSGTVDTQQPTWWNLNTCLRRGIKMFEATGREAVIDHSTDIACTPYHSEAPAAQLLVSPPDSVVSPGTGIQFHTSSLYGPGNPTWRVEGGDANGTIDRTTGWYVAPNRTGEFWVVAESPPIGGKPVQSGRAIVRVGPPTPPGVTVASSPPLENGITTVAMSISRTGPVPDYYIARVIPDRNPFGPCNGTWVINGAYTQITLYDHAFGFPVLRCYQLMPGDTVRFVVTAYNDLGVSTPVTTGPVVIIGPAAARAAAPADGTGASPRISSA